MSMELDPQQAAERAAFVEIVLDELTMILRRDGYIGPDEAAETRAELAELLHRE